MTNRVEHDDILSKSSFFFKDRTFFVKPYLSGEDLAKFKLNIARRRVFVHNIPAIVTNDNLGSIFKIFGPVEDAYLIY